MIDNIWKQFLDIAQEEVGSRVVETWFKAITFKEWNIAQKTIYLQAPNAFVKNWVMQHYIALFQEHLGRLLTVQMPKIVILDSSIKKAEQAGPQLYTNSREIVRGASVIPVNDREFLNSSIIRSGARRQHYLNVNSNYNFNNFVVGPSNSLAYAAAHAIVQKPGILYNPLFICGGPGLGKTHLLQAIGNAIKEQNKQLSVVYCTAAQFVDEFVTAARTDSVQKFQKRYNLADALLVDDIQFLSNKEQSQEAFFHIFNHLHEMGKQVVFSSDLGPHQIAGVGDRLRSRFSSGLVTGLTCPTYAMRTAILHQKIQQEKKVIPDDVVQLIASCSFANVRELEGALIKLLALSSLTSQIMTIELAKTILAPFISESRYSITIDTIVKSIGKYYHCSLEQIKSKKRGQELVIARQLTMYFLKKIMKKSLREIGALLGNRNHSTVLHGLDRIEQLLKDPNFSARVYSIEEDIS